MIPSRKGRRRWEFFGFIIGTYQVSLSIHNEFSCTQCGLVCTWPLTPRGKKQTGGSFFLTYNIQVVCWPHSPCARTFSRAISTLLLGNLESEDLNSYPGVDLTFWVILGKPLSVSGCHFPLPQNRVPQSTREVNLRIRKVMWIRHLEFLEWQSLNKYPVLRWSYIQGSIFPLDGLSCYLALRNRTQSIFYFLIGES